MLRRTVLALVTAPVLLGLWLIPASAQDWREYRPDGFGFRIELPGAPKISTEEVEVQGKSGTIKETTAELSVEPLNFIVSHFEFPEPQSQDWWYDGVRADFWGIGMKIVREEEIVVTGVPGREFALEFVDISYIRRYVIAGKRMIEIAVFSSVLRDRDMERHPVVERFLRSFALLPPLVP